MTETINTDDLPESLAIERVLCLIEDVVVDIREAPSDGIAIGIARKAVYDGMTDAEQEMRLSSMTLNMAIQHIRKNKREYIDNQDKASCHDHPPKSVDKKSATRTIALSVEVYGKSYEVQDETSMSIEGYIDQLKTNVNKGLTFRKSSGRYVFIPPGVSKKSVFVISDSDE